MAKPITILSIDGGGVRGIIPGVMLRHLESELQTLENNPEARIADYFDVISGTSTGGLIATMISASNDQGRPLYAAKEIVPFYKKHCPKIFPRSSSGSEPNENELLKQKSPFYDGNYLHKLARDTLGDKRLSDIILTKIVIPAYDIRKLSPVVFSSYQVDNGNKKLDALLSDICISTSAAPVYLPAYKFSNEGEEFNCIDGGLQSEETDRDKEIDLNNFQLLVLSLGTGEYKKKKYNAALANRRWAINWLIYPLRIFWKADHPLPEILLDANSDMNDYYCTMFFESFGNPENFLRVQDDNLPEELSRLDNGTPQNLNKLEQYAEDMLKKPVTSLDSATFDRSGIDGAATYGDALKEFAKKLYDIKHS
ncbi:hypothetical protein UlMin_033150 [Ulmus minor]